MILPGTNGLPSGDVHPGSLVLPESSRAHPRSAEGRGSSSAARCRQAELLAQSCHSSKHGQHCRPSRASAASVGPACTEYRVAERSHETSREGSPPPRSLPSARARNAGEAPSRSAATRDQRFGRLLHADSRGYQATNLISLGKAQKVTLTKRWRQTRGGPEAANRTLLSV